LIYGDLKFDNMALYGEYRAGAQIIFPKSGRGLAPRSVQLGT